MLKLFNSRISRYKWQNERFEVLLVRSNPTFVLSLMARCNKHIDLNSSTITCLVKVIVCWFGDFFFLFFFVV